MGLLDRIRRTDDQAGQEAREDVGAAIERMMALHPQLRLARHYHKRLAPAVANSFAYVRGLVDAVPAAREASAAAWTRDPYIHAYFAAPGDVAALMSRSRELRAFFAGHGDAPEAHAVLGMELVERHVLGVRLDGDAVRRDVPQKTISFSDHQVRLCGPSDAELRREIVDGLLDQLALLGLARATADKSRRVALVRERALLKTRLQLLGRQGRGIGSLIGGDIASDPGDLARLQVQVEDNARAQSDLGLPEEALDRELEHVRAVFAQPGRHLSVSARRLTVDRLNVVLEPDAIASGTHEGVDLELRIARPPTVPPRMRAFSLVRFARASLLPEKNMFEEAEQLLASGL